MTKIWAVVLNGDQYKVIHAKRLPRKLKKFVKTILRMGEGKVVMTSVGYYDLFTEMKENG